MAELKTTICGIELTNPTILASGILGVTGSSMLNVTKKGAGAVVTKSISLKQRKGHPSPIISTFETGIINAVGLSSMGAEESIKEINFYKENTTSPIIASIFASTAEEFGQVAEKISQAEPDLIEVNVSCPNVQSEFGAPFGTDPQVTAQVVKNVKASTTIPIIVKLTPNVANIVAIGQAAEKAGADALSAINTVGPGMIIDTATAKPILANKMGGVSGPAIRPIAVRCVYQLYQNTNLPIIGIGGITTGNDALEMIMAGASAVQLGSAIHYRGLEVFKKINQEVEEFLDKNDYNSIAEIVGKAHNS